MLKLLDDLPTGPLFFLGTVFALMPFFPEPHLWQKIMMIKDGVHMAPVDWFDIFVHGGAGLLVIAKLVRIRQANASQGAQDGDTNSED